MSACMTLSDYLTRGSISMNEFARRIGAKNARTVQRYIKQGRIPSGTMMARIVAATGGAVQPNDFFALTGNAECLPSIRPPTARSQSAR